MSPRLTGAAFLLLALATDASAAGRAWYLPDQAKLQFAGSIGFLSPGVGWASAGRGLEADLFLGWVPPAIGGDDVFSVTGKLTLQPWRRDLGRRWILRPLYGALLLTYTFGRQYFIRPPPQYRGGYFDGPTALRAGIALGGNVAVRTDGAVREVGLYWEVVALDFMLVSWFRNAGSLGPGDVFSLALGLRAGF